MDTDKSVKLYVYNFPSNYESDDLMSAFQSCGTVQGINVITARFPDDVSKSAFEKTGVEYVYAVVSYDRDTDVSNAISALHGQMIYEGQVKPLIVSNTILTGNQLMYVSPKTLPFFNKGKKLLDLSKNELQKVSELESQITPLAMTNQYYIAIATIKNMLTDVQNYLISLSQCINQLGLSIPAMNQQFQYGQFGPQNFQIPPVVNPKVPSVYVPSTGPQHMGKQNLYNSSPLSMYSPVASIVNEGHSFHSGISSVSSSPSISGVSTVSSNARGPPGANIFVYHLPSSVDNEELSKLFSPFGSVLSTRVYKDPTTGESKGFGFVSYATPESAQLAIAQMNGYHIENKRLKVELKKE